ncbi:heme-binding protein [Candidatus Pseudothioglobus singularis]|nr:heme-binding protein [Candidatus Pseudothioglobus singularis]MDG1345039.1 heme-binding protein [Candidatus Thioglobus sp.]
MKQVLKLTLEDTRKMMDSAINKAIELGIDMDIAIVDDGGHLMLFTRMDNAKITSINVSIDKAFTAAAARKATLDYGKSVINHGPAFGIQTSHQGRFCVVGGGLPLFVDGQIVGGIGCSSGSSDQDIVVAQAGIDAILSVK